jgi:DnaJ family protein C protein 2
LRRKYESACRFDDSFPEEKDLNKDTFLDLYGPVFKRNSKWSEIQPTPSLGDMNTPIDEVKKFYMFWDEFKTWRDFC